MEEQFVVMDVGCFECGVDTEIVGVYKDKEAADRAGVNRKWARYESDGWRDGGSAEVMIFNSVTGEKVKP